MHRSHGFSLRSTLGAANMRIARTTRPCRPSLNRAATSASPHLSFPPPVADVSAADHRTVPSRPPKCLGRASAPCRGTRRASARWSLASSPGGSGVTLADRTELLAAWTCMAANMALLSTRAGSPSPAERLATRRGYRIPRPHRDSARQRDPSGQRPVGADRALAGLGRPSEPSMMRGRSSTSTRRLRRRTAWRSSAPPQTDPWRTGPLSAEGTGRGRQRPWANDPDAIQRAPAPAAGLREQGRGQRDLVRRCSGAYALKLNHLMAEPTMTKHLKNFMRGVGSTVDLAPASRRERFVPRESDADRLCGDFERIRGDFVKSFEAQRRNAEAARREEG